MQRVPEERTTQARWALHPRLIAVVGVMTAVVFVATRLIQVPIPGGYVHLGDSMIYFSAFTFGPLTGGVAGAFGATLADLTSGYANYAPATFIIHGAEGVLAGLIAWRAGVWRMIAAAIVGGLVIVGGYFLYDFFVLRIGSGAAVTDLWFNVGQAVSGGIIGTILAAAVRLAYPPATMWTVQQRWREQSSSEPRSSTR